MGQVRRMRTPEDRCPYIRYPKCTSGKGKGGNGAVVLRMRCVYSEGGRSAVLCVKLFCGSYEIFGETL